MEYQPRQWAAHRTVPRAPREAWARPVRVEQVAGTPYGLAIYGSPPVTSGPAIGALTCGVAALAVASLVLCFGLAGAADGWGPWVAGAFGVLSGALGAGGVGLGAAGARRVSRPSTRPGGGEQPIRGRGLAIAGLICGAVAVLLVVGGIGVSVLLAVL